MITGRVLVLVQFQSTLPVWGATWDSNRRTHTTIGISIHAPRVGSDRPWPATGRPCGRFQSTLPVWGATLSRAGIVAYSGDFNPRSPCGERPGVHSVKLVCAYFNPRSPCGERPTA